MKVARKKTSPVAEKEILTFAKGTDFPMIPPRYG
jgi:hypothetical protein